MPSKSPALQLVLDTVRRTGKGAHPMNGEPYSEPVARVADVLRIDPIALQAEVEAYADAREAALALRDRRRQERHRKYKRPAIFNNLD